MMVDVVGGSLVVVGSALMALGAFGLLRFPDVFTRMHAATKAATVGVIATTTAASIEAGAVGGALILLVVVALLFLSGPLGMSLLARAGYHDPETPRAPSTVELEVELPTAESTPSIRVRGSTAMLALWLFLVWVAAFGSVAPNVVVSGVVVAFGIAYTFRRFAPRWPRAVTHPVAAWRFVVYFIGQMAVSTWDVILALRLRPDRIRPAVLEVPLRSLTRTEVTLLMNSLSFTPGTVALELHDHHLYVHVLDARDPDSTVRGIITMESKIIEAFGGDPASAQAGGHR
ncbi:MAG: monovalent cation/H(+) antiporter subunit G [Acidimicrobiia bacterium]